MNQIEKDILKWYNKDIYSRLGSDISVTELLNPPRIIHLTNRYRDQIKKAEIDKLLPALIGIGVHDQLQRYLRLEGKVNNTWKIERKLTTSVCDQRLTGRFDALYNDKDLYDFKITTAFKALKGDYSDWEKQQNTYAWMLLQDGISVATINICMVVLDWKKVDSFRNQGYPSTRLSIIPLKLWDQSQQEQFVKTSIRSIISCAHESDKNLPLCSLEERWADKPEYKLFKTPDQKRSTKNFPEKKRAEQYLSVCKKRAKEPTDWDKAKIIESVPNQWKRCEGWCDVAPWCNQYKNKLES